MNTRRYIDFLIEQKKFRFAHLDIDGIDNEPAVKLFSESVLEQETCLFADSVRSGNEYCRLLHHHIVQALENHTPLPVVRFADGEYAFYRFTLGCNGLYQQAESIASIKKSMPQHIAALKYVETTGLMAPLIFPGNIHRKSRHLFSFMTQKKDSSAADFLDFLQSHDIHLRPENYIPFYVVYAYLSSFEFAATVHGKHLCILNSDYNEKCCRTWFAERNSKPDLSFVEIPGEYVACRWLAMKQPILEKIPNGVDLCLVGAGVGALLICHDVASKYSVPAVDAGHVLNIMNNRTDKSNGVRLYTLRKMP